MTEGPSVSPVSPAGISTPGFLQDVAVCALGAYGGPETHISVFLRQMVVKRRYLNEEELLELIALCSLLPGPTSTQTITALGYRCGGPRLALLTLLVWAVPAVAVMTVLSFLYAFLSAGAVSTEVLRFIGPMAVGFIAVAALRVGRLVARDSLSVALMLIAALVTYFFRSPWVFPVVLLGGGAVALVLSNEERTPRQVHIHPPWRYVLLFAGVGALATALALGTELRWAGVFESFYRYGYLVFGGGQVVVPVMFNELVELRGYLTEQEFLTGYGLVQGIPGPMFSFAAFAGGLASRGVSVGYQVIGALLAGTAIFLPGTLLIFFVAPVWEEIKQISAVQIAFGGVKATAAGLIAVAALILLQASGLNAETVVVAAVSAGLFGLTKLPAPVIVFCTIAAGLLL